MLFIKRTFIIRQAYAMRLRYKLPSLSTYLMDMQVCFAVKINYNLILFLIYRFPFPVIAIHVLLSNSLFYGINYNEKKKKINK